MKNSYKAALLVTLGLASVMTAKADSGGDLLIGFTQQGANSGHNDLYYDLGAVSSFTSGQTWDLSSALSGANLDLTQVLWGAVGNDQNGDSQFANPHTGLTWLTDSGTPQNQNGFAAFNLYGTAVNTIESVITGQANTVSTVGQNAQVAYDLATSWYSETVNPTLGTQLYNASGGADINQTGTGSIALWQIQNNNSAPTQIGTLNFDGSNGLLTFTATPVPEPASASLIGGGALLLLTFRNKFRRQQV